MTLEVISNVDCGKTVQIVYILSYKVFAKKLQYLTGFMDVNSLDVIVVHEFLYLKYCVHKSDPLCIMSVFLYQFHLL